MPPDTYEYQDKPLEMLQSTHLKFLKLAKQYYTLDASRPAVAPFIAMLPNANYELAP